MVLAFLAVYVGQHLHEVTWLLEQGFNEAWGRGARSNFCMDTHELIYGGRNDNVPSASNAMKASKYFARAVAVVIRLILEGIVLYITARGVAKLPELVAQLKSSRLGPGFAGWVEKNHLRLMNNPKLKRSTGTGGATEQPARVLTDHTTMKEQPRPGQTKKELPPLRQKYVDEVAKLKDKAANMRKEGYSEEEIARTLQADRRALGVEYKNATEPELLEKIYQRNNIKYGDKLGPTIDYLRSRGKTWEQITEGACRPGGQDLGF